MKLFILMLAGALLVTGAAFGHTYSAPPSGSIVPITTDRANPGITPGALDWTVLGSVTINVPSPTGLAYDGQYFRVPDWTGGNPSTIYTIDPATGATVGSIPAPSQWPGGIAWDGNYLWVEDYISQAVICKVDPANGQVLNTFPIPYSYYWAGVAWDGQYVYFGTNTSPGAGQPDYIYKMDPAAGTLLGSFAIPSTYISGLDYHDGHLWYSDSQEMMLYKITTNGVVVETSPAAGSYPSGVAFANGYLYNVDHTLRVIYQYDITPPVMSVILTPVNPPILIPASGGTFGFNIAAANLGTTQASFDVWTNVTLPTGGTTGPLILAQNLTLGAGITVDRDRLQNVPANAPAGIYAYNAYVGSYPSTVWADDEFAFEKSAASDGGINISSWICAGEPFDNENSETPETMPVNYQLLSANPNPFNPSTTIFFELQQASEIKLAVFDIQGREIQALGMGYWALGKHSVVWDASGQASGVYFVRLMVDGRWSMVEKVVLMK